MRALRAPLAAAALVCAAGLAVADLANGIKAIVNDAVITYQQVEMLAAPAAESLRRQYAGQPELFQKKMAEVFNNALEQLIERQLILAEFKSAGYNLPESVIDEAIQERIRDRFGDRSTLIKNLQAGGITYEQYRQQVREQIIIDALSQKNVSSGLIVSPQKVEAYYNQHQDDFKLEDRVRLRMIVLDGSAVDTAEGRKNLAQEIRGKIDGGAPFSEMAAIYSTGSQRKEGGNWGWVDGTVLRKELAEVAFRLKAGERSDVIETPEACYLMLVEEAEAAHVKPLVDVREEIEKTLQLQERARLRKQWIDRLRSKTLVRYF